MPLKTSSFVVQPVGIPEIDKYLYDLLKTDIERRGILVPVIRDANTNELIDGRIRMQICEELGIRDVPTIFVGKLSQTDCCEIRNSVNLLRRHLNRYQIQSILDWAVRSTPYESNRKIAARIGVDKNTVGAARKRVLVGEIHQPEAKRIGRDGKSYSAAKPSVYTSAKGQREVVRRNLVALGDEAPDEDMSPRKVRKLAGRKERAALNTEAVKLPAAFSIKDCDFRKHEITSGSIDLCYCDPPWGAEWKKNRADYARENFEILKPGGIAICYFGQTEMLDWIDVFRKTGFVYQWMLACVNDDQRGSCSFYGSFLASWRQVLLFQKPGLRFRTTHLMPDVFHTKNRGKPNHPWQQPVEEADSIIRGLTRNGAAIADLTACSFTSGVACAQIGSRKYYGIEIEEDLCNLGRSRINEVLILQKV